MSASVSSPRLPAGRAEGRPGRRQLFAIAGAAAIVVCLVPPVETLSLRYVVAESVQFMVFALVAPALIVMGAPWRLLRLSRAGAAGDGRPAGTPGPLDRLAAGRQDQRRFLRAGVYLIAFMAVTLVWRLPPVMDTLLRQPALVVPEMITMVAAGVGVWLELLDSPPLAPRLPRPHRAAIAALAMWFTWAVAYVIGFQNRTVFGAYAAVPGRALSLVADQEIAVAVIWAVAGLCFVPLVAVSMIGWLKDGDADEELQRIVRDGNQRAVVKGWGAPAPGRRHQPHGGSGSAS